MNPPRHKELIYVPLSEKDMQRLNDRQTIRIAMPGFPAEDLQDLDIVITPPNRTGDPM